MGLLKVAKNETAYMKAGILGFAGSGKTFTAKEIAIGLAKLNNGKQIAFFDTEKGSDFVKKDIEKAGLELLVHKGRAFTDLISVIKEVEQAKIPVLIIDSISHVWRDLCDSYAKKYNKKSLTMYDWGILKGQWKQYTDLYINSSVHILMLGRAGYDYDTQTNEDTGKQEMIKSGTKMKVEGETGFEPDILIEMERFETKDGIINRAWIMKDRTNTMNGKCFEKPNFKTFKPFIDFLNIGGEHKGIDTQRDSSGSFEDRDWSYEERKRRRDIALEKIEEALTLAGMSGTSIEAKKNRTDVLIKVFGTSTKTGIESMDLVKLEEGVQELRYELKIDKREQDPPKVDSNEAVSF